MENLVNVLNMIVEKYQVAEEDMMMIQEALGELENGGVAEFDYETVEDTTPEEDTVE